MCANNWSRPYPLQIERREKSRAGLIEEFFTTTYNVMRRHMPETMEPCNSTVSDNELALCA